MGTKPTGMRVTGTPETFVVEGLFARRVEGSGTFPVATGIPVTVGLIGQQGNGSVGMNCLTEQPIPHYIMKQ